MCRERGSVLFYPRNDFQSLVYQQHEPEGLIIDAKKQQHTHLLSANNETILNEIIEKEKLELLKQLEEDGEQPEACFIKQALEENNVTYARSQKIDFCYFLFVEKRTTDSRTSSFEENS